MHELAILKWAAGAKKPLPRIDDVDQELILESVLQHRLEGRLLRRLKLDPQPWIEQNILTELEERRSDNQSRIKRQLNAINEINCEYASSGQTMILIKGYCPYFLLGDPAIVRFSWDVDILCDDPIHMRETLFRLGYRWSPTATVEAHHSPRSYRRDLDFSVDSYNYIPIWSYPRNTAIADFDPALNQGHWNQTATPIHNEMRVADFADHLSASSESEVGPLAIPDPTMTVLITCAHLFTDFLNGMPGPYGRLRLARFAEISELCEHPAFDRKKFSGLVRKFDAFDSVQFTAALLKHYLGYDPLQVRFRDQRSWKRYYRSCFWLPGPASYDELLLSKDPAEPLRHLVNEVGANEIFVTSRSVHNTYWTKPMRKDMLLKRVITRNEGRSHLPVGISLSCDLHGLLVEIEVVGLPDAEDFIYIEIAGFPLYWAINRDGLRRVIRRSLARYKISDFAFTDRGYILRLEFPWVIRKGNSIRTSPLPLLLAVARLADGRMGRPTIDKFNAATLIPVNIVIR